MTNRDDVDVVIIGCGIIGMSTALSLSRLGVKVKIIDDSDYNTVANNGKNLFRSYALSDSSMNFFKNIGLDIEGICCPMLDILVYMSNYINGPYSNVVELSRRDTNIPVGFMVMDQRLRTMMLKSCFQKTEIDISFSQKTVKITRVSDSKVKLECADGRTYLSNMVIIANGSSVTSTILGEEYSDLCVYTEYQYKQKAIVGNITHEKENKFIAHECFMPSGTFALLPLDQHTSSYVWIEKESYVQNMQKANMEIFSHELGIRVGSALGEIQHFTEYEVFPLKMRVANRIACERIALVGDAAKKIHPLAGQGLNYGIRDVSALRDVVLQDLQIGKIIGSSMSNEEYQSRRRFDNTMIAGITTGINFGFTSIFSPIAGLCLEKTRNSNLIKGAIMNYASGTACGRDIPSMLKI